MFGDAHREACGAALFVALYEGTWRRHHLQVVSAIEEYRPYPDGMEEFRAEIGKYVEIDEVTRLESYVTLN